MKFLLVFFLVSFTEATEVCIHKPWDTSSPRSTFLQQFNFTTLGTSRRQQNIHTIDFIEDIKNISSLQIQRLKKEVLRYGVVRIPQQKLNFREQVAFSEELGEVVTIPESFRGNHVLPNFPEIVPVSNYWQNGTWKGKTHSFGQYWHKDYDFVPFDQGYVWSMLYANEYDPRIVGGDTGFVDACALRDRIPERIERVLTNTTLSQSVRDIPDFVRRANEEELSQFPRVHHKVIFQHPGKNRKCVFLRPVDSLPEGEVRSALVQLWGMVEDPIYVMRQKWKEGDVVIWDNYGVFHRAMPIVSGTMKRIFYRTQIQQQSKMKS